MAEHDIEKIVEAGGEVFNFRDPTKRSIIQDVSKGANLVVNGNGVVGTNYNFGARTFIGNTDLPEGTAGCFHAVANTIWHDEPIAVDVGKTYEAEVWYRVKSANTSTVRFSVCCFDVDDKEIQAIFSTYGVGTLTELTQDLKPGDTVVHLADLSGANWLSETNYHHGFIFWNYQNSLGYTYPPETYSRNVYPQGNVYLWDDSSAVNVSAGTITLKAAWNGPTIPAGTKVSRRNSGVVYKYIQYTASSSASTSWEKLSGKVFGMTTPGSADGGSFRRGTAYIRIGFYNSNTTTNEYIEFTGMSLRELPAKLDTARKLKTNLARTSDSTFDGSADQLNIPVTGTLPVGNGGTGKNSVTSGNYLVGNGSSAMVEKAPKDVGSNVLSSLDDKSNASSYADFVDGDFVVGSDHVNASTISASTFVRRTALNLWNYIKSKLSGSDVNIGGNAATATNATTADTAKAYDPTFSGTNSIASALESKVTEIAFTEGNASAATDLTNVVLCGLKFSGSSVSSGRLSFCLSLTINRGTQSKGGILRVDVATYSSGSAYNKRITLTARSGGLDVSEFYLVTGTNGGKPVIGVVWNGTTESGEYMDVRVLDYKVVSGTGSFIYDAVLSNKTQVYWGDGNKWQGASDEDVVHKAGTETISGVKEFARSGQFIDFTDTDGAKSDVRVRTSTSSPNGSAQLEANRTSGRYGVYAVNAYGDNLWVACLDNDGVVNLGNSSHSARIAGTKFVFNASQLGTEADTFYWI